MRVGFGPLHLRCGCLAITGFALVWAAPANAQTPPDSAQAVDTAAVLDSLSTPTAQDSVSADTIFYNLPSLESGVPEGFATGVWVWDRDDIMASGANTVAEIVAEVPGLIQLLGGDYGTPAAVSAFGTGGGGVRVIRDGFEVFPLEGGVADLQRVGLGGITRVRLERAGGELVIELFSHEFSEGRPYSLVEAGTGQLATNVFRGTYADPTALGGSVALALERVDTRGFGIDEGGNRTGTWFRYQLNRGNRAGLAFDYRRMGSQTEVPDYAASVRRTDLTLRARVEIVDGLVAEAYTGRSSHDVDDVRPQYDFEGGTRAQHGVRLAARGAGLWARGAYRLYTDDDLPAHRLDGSGGYTGGRFGASGHVAQASWAGTAVTSYGAGAWLRPIEAVSVFGSWDSGTFAGRSGPPLDVLPEPEPPAAWPVAPPGPTFATTERTALRLGGSLSLLDVTLAAAALRTDADVHLPLGLELDRGSPLVAGAERNGVEAWGSLPTRWGGLRIEGSYQHWDQGGPYLPKRIYRGAFVFHKTYLETENFELWWSLGVRGHDPMGVFVPDDGQGGPGGLETVPFYQNWYGRIQVRIVSVRLFLGWENFTIRRNLQNFPNRRLPATRSFFGLRWDLWN